MAVPIHRVSDTSLQPGPFNVFRHYKPIKSSRTGSVVVADIPGHEAGLLEDIQLASMISCEARWLKYGGASGSGGGSEFDVVDPLILGDLKLLFERDAG